MYPLYCSRGAAACGYATQATCMQRAGCSKIMYRLPPTWPSWSLLSPSPPGSPWAWLCPCHHRAPRRPAWPRPEETNDFSTKPNIFSTKPNSFTIKFIIFTIQYASSYRGVRDPQRFKKRLELQIYSFWIQNSSFSMQNSSFLIHNSLFSIRNSSFVRTSGLLSVPDLSTSSLLNI